MNHMVSHGLKPFGLRFNGLYFISYQELARATLIFKSNAKVTFSQGGATDIQKKLFGSPTIMMKTAWKRQNSGENFPAKKFRDFRVITTASECPLGDSNIINYSLQSIGDKLVL